MKRCNLKFVGFIVTYGNPRRNRALYRMFRIQQTTPGAVKPAAAEV